MNPTSNDSIIKYLRALLLPVILLGILIVVSAISTAKNTGYMDIKTSDKAAKISISQPDHAAAALGTGEARVRLNPGKYTVVAVKGETEAVETITISAQQKVEKKLLLQAKHKIPTADSVSFVHLSSLEDTGLTTTQINALRQAFFDFKPTEHVVDIDEASVKPAPHDPRALDPSFTTYFSVKVDSDQYTATTKYSGLDTVQLILADSQNHTVYDSGPASAE